MVYPELGVEKQLGISGKHEIEEYGIEPFILKCKESVFTYEKQWREFTESIGYGRYGRSICNFKESIYRKCMAYFGDNP